MSLCHSDVGKIKTVQRAGVQTLLQQLCGEDVVMLSRGDGSGAGDGPRKNRTTLQRSEGGGGCTGFHLVPGRFVGEHRGWTSNGTGRHARRRRVDGRSENAVEPVHRKALVEEAGTGGDHSDGSQETNGSAEGGSTRWGRYGAVSGSELAVADLALVFIMDKVAPEAIRAEAGSVERAAHFSLVLGMAQEEPHLSATVRELTLVAVLAEAVLLELSAQFRLVTCRVHLLAAGGENLLLSASCQHEPRHSAASRLAHAPVQLDADTTEELQRKVAIRRQVDELRAVVGGHLAEVLYRGVCSQLLAARTSSMNRPKSLGDQRQINCGGDIAHRNLKCTTGVLLRQGPRLAQVI